MCFYYWTYVESRHYRMPTGRAEDGYEVDFLLHQNILIYAECWLFNFLEFWNSLTSPWLVAGTYTWIIEFVFSIWAYETITVTDNWNCFWLSEEFSNFLNIFFFFFSFFFIIIIINYWKNRKLWSVKYSVKLVFWLLIDAFLWKK